MTMSGGGAFGSLDELLHESVARWARWRAEHSEPVDSDEYVAALGELIEALLPTSAATLQRLAVDPRIWTHDHGTGENTVLGSVQAALTSLIVDHLDTSTEAAARQHHPELTRPPGLAAS